MAAQRAGGSVATSLRICCISCKCKNKKIKKCQCTTSKCKIPQHIWRKHGHDLPCVASTPSFSGENLMKYVFQMENILFSGCVEQNTSVKELFRRCKYLMQDYVCWSRITFTSTVIAWTCVGVEKQHEIIKLTYRKLQYLINPPQQ